MAAKKGERVPPKKQGEPLVSTPNRVPDQWLRSGKFLSPSTAEVVQRLRWEGKIK